MQKKIKIPEEHDVILQFWENCEILTQNCEIKTGNCENQQSELCYKPIILTCFIKWWKQASIGVYTHNLHLKTSQNGKEWFKLGVIVKLPSIWYSVLKTPCSWHEMLNKNRQRCPSFHCCEQHLSSLQMVAFFFSIITE